MSSLFDEFFHSFPSLADKATGSSLPSVNISETEDACTLELSSPGFQKEEFSIEVEDQMLIVSGEKKTDSEVKREKLQQKRILIRKFQKNV